MEEATCPKCGNAVTECYFLAVYDLGALIQCPQCKTKFLMGAFPESLMESLKKRGIVKDAIKVEVAPKNPYSC